MPRGFLARVHQRGYHEEDTHHAPRRPLAPPTTGTTIGRTCISPKSMSSAAIAHELPEEYCTAQAYPTETCPEGRRAGLSPPARTLWALHGLMRPVLHRDDAHIFMLPARLGRDRGSIEFIDAVQRRLRFATTNFHCRPTLLVMTPCERPPGAEGRLAGPAVCD